jgi:NDP-hexose 4-ketoreductase
MRLLIIGASGFLGTHVRHQAAAAGIEVVTAGRRELPDSGRHHRVDLARDDPRLIAWIVSAVAPDAVVNCAGATGGNPDVLVNVNVNGTYALIKAMLLAGTPARLVHLGSAAEYGRTEPGVPVTERVTARPVATYGATKLAGTRLVELAAAAGLRAVVLRVFNPVGSGAPLSSLPGRLAAELRQATIRGIDARVGSLDAARDFIDARDVADAVICAAAAPAPPRPVLNIGSGDAVPLRAVVRELLAISGCTAAVHEAAPASARSPGVAWQQADISCAIEDLGWKPVRSLRTALIDLWEASA